MVEWNYMWWKQPDKEADIASFIENKFQFSGDHVWMKLLKQAIENRYKARFQVKKEKDQSTSNVKEGA